MSSIVILTGSPGTGKTTLARVLAQARPRGLHLPSDVFYTFPAHPISPYRPEAREQVTDIVVALTRTALAFAQRGYDVVLDGIFGPWFLDLMLTELRPTGIPVHYVVLQVSLETALRRVDAREGSQRAHMVRTMHPQFADLGRYAAHVLNSEEGTAVVAAEFERRHASGAFQLM